eukprot:958195-Pleurochrysis_carterae.AAC.2
MSAGHERRGGRWRDSGVRAEFVAGGIKGKCAYAENSVTQSVQDKMGVMVKASNRKRQQVGLDGSDMLFRRAR